MKQERYVYHMVPKGFEGDTLYPLNQLKTIRPDLAAVHAEKYKGREALMEQRIPTFDCLWNDVLMFLPVHPAEVTQTFHDAGYKVKPIDYFEIPLSTLKLEQTAVFLFAKQREFGDFAHDPDEFVMLADVNFDELTILGDKLAKHIERSKKDGRNPVRFGSIPHIFYHGALSVADIKTVTY